jgi:hypothetical protein
MDTAANKAIARRYFSEIVDKRSDKLLEELSAVAVAKRALPFVKTGKEMRARLNRGCLASNTAGSESDR